MRNMYYSQQDFLKIKDKILALGFEEAGSFYFRKVYSKDISPIYGVIRITGEEWVDNEVVIDIKYPADDTNLSDKGIKAFLDRAKYMIDITNSMNKDLTEIFKLLETNGGEE